MFFVRLSAHSAEREKYIPRKGWIAQGEEHPSQRDEVEGEQYAANLQSSLQTRIGCIETSLCKITPTVLEEETQSMPCTPENKVDRDPMPQADEQHR